MSPMVPWSVRYTVHRNGVTSEPSQLQYHILASTPDQERAAVLAQAAEDLAEGLPEGATITYMAMRDDGWSQQQ